MRQPRPGPGAPRVLSPFRRFADGKASSSSSVNVAATADIEPGGGAVRRCFVTFLTLVVCGDSVVVSAVVSRAMDSSASSSSDEYVISLRTDMSASCPGSEERGDAVASFVDAEAESVDACLDVPPAPLALLVDGGTRSRTLNVVM